MFLKHIGGGSTLAARAEWRRADEGQEWRTTDFFASFGTPSASIRLVSSRSTDHSWAMATLLLPMQEGEIWRVQIVWLNGHVNYFGKFTSEKDAVAWIDAHPRLTKPVDTVDAPPLAGD